MRSVSQEAEHVRMTSADKQTTEKRADAPEEKSPKALKLTEPTCVPRSDDTRQFLYRDGNVHGDLVSHTNEKVEDYDNFYSMSMRHRL